MRCTEKSPESKRYFSTFFSFYTGGMEEGGYKGRIRSPARRQAGCKVAITVQERKTPLDNIAYL